MGYKYLTLERKGDVFIVTLQKPPQNRLDVEACQEIISAYREAEKALGQDSEGAVILRSNEEKYFTTGLDLDERDRNPYAPSDGFYPLVATILDFPFPTIALINGHVMGGSVVISMAHDYRIMNSKKGYFQMPPVNAGLHHPEMGSLFRLKLHPRIARKMLLEAHRWTGEEAFRDGVVDVLAEPHELLEKALQLAEKWKSKAKMGVYGKLRNELVGDATRAYQMISYVHHKETSNQPRVKL